MIREPGTTRVVKARKEGKKVMNNIRLFGQGAAKRWIAIRRPTEAELAEVSRLGLVQVAENQWMEGSQDISAFDPYREWFNEGIYIISNRAHYLGAKDDDVTADDLVQDWPIFTINYAIEQVPAEALERGKVFSFWQDNVPRPEIPESVIKVFGTLAQEKGEKNVLRINPLVLKPTTYTRTPKTLHLALTVGQLLGIRFFRIFNAYMGHPVNQQVLKDPHFRESVIDFGCDLGIDEGIMGTEGIDI